MPRWRSVSHATLVLFDYDRAQDLQFFVDAEWIEVISAGYTIGLDGISLPLYFLSMAVTFLVMISRGTTPADASNAKAFYALMLILQTGMAGTFIAQDLILFFVFFEVVLLPMYFMIGVWGGEDRKYASLKFFLYTMFGSGVHARCVPGAVLPDRRRGTASFEWLVAPGRLDRPQRPNLDLRGHVPQLRGEDADVRLHTWLPDRAHAGPHAGLGDPGHDPAEARHLRIRAHRIADAPAGCRSLGAGHRHPRRDRHHLRQRSGCLAQTDMKRLIAFSSVAHMGFVMLGISTLTEFGVNAALFGMVAHGLITGMLFFIAGSIKHHYHTLKIKRLSGMLIQMPKMGYILGFAAMASLGLPGLAGFWASSPQSCRRTTRTRA